MCSLCCLDWMNTFSLPFLFRGCLFYGPPGTGKTLVARALANECSHGDRKVSFFMRKGADCLSKWVGESERQLRLLFDQVGHSQHTTGSNCFEASFSVLFFAEHHDLVLCLLLIRLTWWGHPLFSLMRLMVWLLFARAGKTRYTGKTHFLTVVLYS